MVLGVNTRFVSINSEGLRFETARLLFFFIVVNVPRANSSEEMRVAERARLARRKAGAAKAGAAASRFERETSYEKG